MPEQVVDLITGERKPYNPAPPPDNSGMEGLNPRFLESLSQQPVDVALKAVDAAIQFQGLRGYQQALKNGVPSEKAMAKFGPMIFRKTPQALGPSIRALTPPAARPTSALDQARIDEMKRKGLLPPSLRSASPGSWVIDASGKVVQKVPSAAQTRAEGEQFDTVTEKYPVETVPPDITPARGRFNPFVANTPAVTNAPGRTIPEHTVTRKIPRGSSAFPATAPTAPANVTQQEYEKLNSGDLYWWNGKRIPKK